VLAINCKRENMFKSRRLKAVSNAIKTVGVNDLSQGLSSKSFALDEVSISITVCDVKS
jgi:hypothetical protein